SDTQLLIRGDQFFRDGNRELALTKIRDRLLDGEQAVIERGSDSLIRLVLSRRLELRGGRARVLGAARQRSKALNPALIGGLKRAHAQLEALKASPFT